MKRKEKSTPKITSAERPGEKKLKYVKIAGTLRLKNPRRIIKRGQKFEAYPSEIADIFMAPDCLVCLEPEKLAKIKAGGEFKPPKPKLKYKIKMVKKGEWNVIHAKTKKKQNEEKLKKSEAIALCKSVNEQ